MGEGQPPYTEWQLGGESIGGGMEMGKDMPSSVPSFWMVYFGVAAVDATAKKASELGGKVNLAPQAFPGGRFAILGAPQGACLRVLRMRSQNRARHARRRRPGSRRALSPE